MNPDWLAIMLAGSANAVLKLGVVRTVGGGALFRRCLPPWRRRPRAVGLTLFAPSHAVPLADGRFLNAALRLT